MGLGRVLAPRFQAGTIALFIRWRGGAARRRISFWHLPWPPSYGVDVTAGGLHRQGDGSRTCARSEIPGWHDRALYPLAGRRRAPPDFFLALCAELGRVAPRLNRGATSPPAACTGKVMGLGRVLAPRFQAGTIALFIRWRGGAARRRISFWHLPWPPSYGVDVTAGGLHRQGDGSRTCARSEIPGWHDRALYPLAGRRRAPPDLSNSRKQGDR